MPQNKATIQAQFAVDDGAREGVLERARTCAALTKPWVLPPSGQAANQKLPENFQSVGSRGVSNMEGRMLLALWPPGTPWFNLLPQATLRYDDTVDPAIIEAINRRLFLQELVILARLEASNLKLTAGRQSPGTFRSRKRATLSQIFVTGDSLEQMMDDYSIRLFGRAQYVTKRNSASEVLYHITHEKLDPLGLTDEERLAAEFNNAELAEKTVTERQADMFTRCEWQPISKLWLIEQEVNEKVIRRSEEPVTPFFSTAYELAPGEDYGRGFVELNLGDLRTLDELEQRMLDFAAIASDVKEVLDNNSTTRVSDLEGESGSIIRAKVTGGVVQDVAYLKSDRLSDFNVVHLTATRKRDDLGKAMLMEAETQPTGDRVTAYQVQRIAMELEGALGGIYSSIADEQQTPLLRRTIWQMRNDNLLPLWEDDDVEVHMVTGIAALSRELDLAKLRMAIQDVATLGPEALQKINLDVLVDLVFRMRAIEHAGLVKSREQVKQELQELMRQQAEAAAVQKGIDVVGNVAQAQATPAATGEAAPTGA